MRAAAAAVLALVVLSVPAVASPDVLRARVVPAPATLATRTWSPVVTLTDSGRPAAAPLTLAIAKGGERRAFRPRAVRRGSYRVRVSFPSDGRWSWMLSARGRALARGSIAVSTEVTFDLPYDLALAPDGTIYFLDRARVLALDPATRRIRVHAATGAASELIAMERLADGTLYVTDFPGGRILRVDPSRRVTPVAQVEAPADLVADAAGTTLWVASIADGVGVVRVDVASGRVVPFAHPFQPHGIDRDPDGDFVVHDGHVVSRIDGETGAVSPFAAVDAFKLLVAPDRSVLGVEGDPSGGRIVRIAPDGTVTAVAGTGSLAPHRDGPALTLGILPTSIELAPDGAILFTQGEPIAAVRRIDPATGLVTTIAGGRSA